MSAASGEPDDLAQLRQRVERLHQEFGAFNARLGDLEDVVTHYFDVGVPKVPAKKTDTIAPLGPQTAEPIEPKLPLAESKLPEVLSPPFVPPVVKQDPIAPRPLFDEGFAPQPTRSFGVETPREKQSLPQEQSLPERVRDFLDKQTDSIPQAAETFARNVSKKFAKPTAVDWETIIGGRWMTWAGAFTLLLAVGFAVHWAWSTFETPPWLQVLGVHLLGVGFLVGAFVVRRRGLPATTQALVGLGIFTLYAAAFAALHLYKLWPEHIAFFECAGLTVLAIALALYADSVAVVLLGALGGYLTPILTSSGSGNYVGLFTYLAFLNIALVACAVWRDWQFLKPLALAATALMFGGWLGNSRFDISNTSMVWGTQWFAALHASIFLLGSTVPPLAWKRMSRGPDLFALGANSLLFIAITWVLFRERPEQQLALVSWGLSLLHGVLFGVTYARLTNSDRMPRIHLALSAIFFTLAIPLQIDNSAFWGATWCLEGLVITAVGVYFRDRQMCVTAAIVLLLGAARLLGWDFHSPATLVGATDIDRRALMFALSGLMALFTGGMYRFIPWAFKRAEVDSELKQLLAGTFYAVGAALLTVAPFLQLQDRTYLGPVWGVEALLFTIAGLALRERQLSTTGLMVFALAAGRLLVFDFLSPARTLGNSAIDLRCASFLWVGFLALGCGVLFRIFDGATNRRMQQRGFLGVFSRDFSKLSSDDFGVLCAAGLSLLGAILITCSPPLQLTDWTLLGPIWATEAMLFTVLGIMFRDRLFSFIGVAIFAVAAARLGPWEFRAQSRLIEGTSWDLRFVVIAISGLLAIAAGSMYWAIPRLLRRERLSESERAVGSLLLCVGNLALMFSLLCQWNDRRVLALWTLDAAVIWAAGFWFNQRAVRLYAAALALVMVLGRALHDGNSLDGPFVLIANARFASLALVAAMFFAVGGMYRQRLGKNQKVGEQLRGLVDGAFGEINEAVLDPLFGILANAVLLTAISFEIHSWYATAVASGYTPFPDMRMAEMATYSIVWAIYAAIVVALGFALRYPLFRLLGLIAFGPILLKVFFIDLENLRWLPRVLALAVLGLMLMGVSMLYQKFASRMKDAEEVESELGNR